MSLIFDNKIKGFLFNNFKNTANIENILKKNINDGNILYNELLDKFGNVVNMSDSDINAVVIKLNKLKSTYRKIFNIVNITIRQINSVNDAIKIISTIITISKIIITILKALPIPAQFLTSGIIVTFSDILQKADRKIEFLDTIIRAVKPFLKKLLEILEKNRKLLQTLDEIIGLIEAFLAQRSISFAKNMQNNAIDAIKLTQVALNIEENTNTIGFYNDFRFELRQEDNPQFQVNGIKRNFAVAIDTKGIERLKSQSSFASNPEILIEELKQIIDVNGFKA